MALTIDSVQSGQVVIDSTSKTVTITDVGDISDCILLFTVSADESFPQPQHSAIRGEITNTTTLTFTVIDVDSSSRTVEWQVIEFAAADVDVQRGATTPSPVPTDVTISSVGDLDDALEILSGVDMSGTGIQSDSLFEAFLSSTTNLRIDGATGKNSVDVAWQVCRFETAAEFSAQRGALATDTASTTEFTATITSVNQSNAFAVANGWKIDTSGGTVSFCAYLAKLNSSTEVAIQKNTANTADAEARWLVGELPNVDAQAGAFSFASSDAQETAAITSVSADRAIFASGWSIWGNSTGKGAHTNDRFGEVMARMKFNSATQIQGDRGATNDAAEVQWVVLDFSPSGGASSVDETDSGSGSDSLDLSAAVPVSDSGSAADALASIDATVTVSDTATGADVLALAVSLALVESGSGADDVAVTLTISIADSGSGADAAPGIGASLPLADSGVGADGSSVSVILSLPDSGSGADLVDLITDTILELADSGAGSDAIEAIAAAIAQASEVGVGADSIGVQVDIDFAESGSGVDSIADPEVVAAIADVGSALEQAVITAVVAVSETGSGTDSVATLAQEIARAVRAAFEDRVFVAMRRDRVLRAPKRPAVVRARRKLH